MLARERPRLRKPGRRPLRRQEDVREHAVPPTEAVPRGDDDALLRAQGLHGKAAVHRQSEDLPLLQGLADEAVHVPHVPEE